MNYKYWYQSKTIWFNIITVLVSVAGVATARLGDLNLAPELEAYFSMLLVAISSAGNLFLRSITSSAIK